MHDRGNTGRAAELITTAKRLEEVATELMALDAIAVDTEFFWESTFYPILGLVHLAGSDGSCWLVDAVNIKDLSALGPVMASTTVTKVLHDAPQDLSILARATGAMPRMIFDTRLAAGFAGLSATSSLQALLREVSGIELSKAETRSNWVQRPLTPNQLRYAADDVLHLLKLREQLLAACANDTVRSWLNEELKRLDDPTLYQEREPRLMYLRIKGTFRLRADELSVLRELAAWREEEARQRDWPRGHVMPDNMLVTLAQCKPCDRAALTEIPDFPDKMPAAVTEALLTAVRRGLAVPPAEYPRPVEAAGAKQKIKSRTDRLLAQICDACKTHHIDPALVGARAEIESFLQLLDQGAAAEHPFTTGWRRTFITEELHQTVIRFQ
jgi:ribonuclease D